MTARYVFEGRKGNGYAYNVALAQTRGKVLLFTDDDIHVPVNWVEGMCRPFLEGAAHAVQGGIAIAPHLDRPWLKGALRIWCASVENPAWASPGLVGANMAIGRQATEAAGLFDLRLGPGAAGYFDDTVYGWAVAKAGLTVLFRPEVTVEHHFDPSRLGLPAFMAAARRMAASRAIVDRDANPTTHPPSVMMLIAQFPGLAARFLIQAAKLLISGEPDAGFVVRDYDYQLWHALRRAG
ncbi:glycosyltransferase family 2 protein [Phenylobacterium sp.]|uniref:glycosyltransferase family 2 protein n=1 Tax=Phenylobacterium sp. TaxID=1871053 RepID=UPI0025E2CF75|nr:glycosyltransferase family 2 protein [Phenylobacterium sp.]